MYHYRGAVCSARTVFWCSICAAAIVVVRQIHWTFREPGTATSWVFSVGWVPELASYNTTSEATATSVTSVDRVSRIAKSDDSATKPVDREQAPHATSSIRPRHTFSTSLECKIAYDKVRVSSTQYWAWRGLPNFGFVKEIGDRVYIFFDQAMVPMVTKNKMDRQFFQKLWLCVYNDSHIENEFDLWPSVPSISIDTEYYAKAARPRHSRKAGILTAVYWCPSYHNGRSLRGIVATHKLQSSPMVTSNKDSNTSNIGHPYYNLTHALECDRLEQEQEDPILREKNITVGICIHFFGPTAKNFLKPWIEYHRMLGVDHFWLYQHEPWDPSGLPQNKSYITYEPYDWKERTKRWKTYPFQESMRHNCMFRAKRLGIPWILGTDPDEYLHVTKQFANGTTKLPKRTGSVASQRPLLRLLDSYKDVGAVRLHSVPYGNHPDNATWPPKKYPPNDVVVLDYSVWRHRGPMDTLGWGRTKMIYNVSSTWSLGMHYLWAADLPLRDLSADTEAYVQHHTQSHKGVTQGGHKTKFEAAVDIELDTRVRDQYLSRIQHALWVEYGEGGPRSDSANVSVSSIAQEAKPLSPAANVAPIDSSLQQWSSELLQKNASLHQEWAWLMKQRPELGPTRSKVDSNHTLLPGFILPIFVDAEPDSDLSLAVPCSVDRLDRVVRLVDEDWGRDGPVSVAVYLPNPNAIKQLIDFLQVHADLFAWHTTFHVMLETPTLRRAGKSVKEYHDGFPHNHLREMALHGCSSPFVVLLDADFRIGPGPNIHSKLQKVLNASCDLNPVNGNATCLSARLRRDLVALVIPAFDLIAPIPNGTLGDTGRPSISIPKSKREVVDLFRNKTAIPFGMAKNHDAGHRLTNYEKWIKQDGSTPTYTTKANKYMEPYVVAYRPTSPHYWPNFRGFGLNKFSFFHEFVLMGGRLEVLNNFFVVHVWHPSNFHKRQLKQNIQIWKKTFQPYLTEKYKSREDVRYWATT